MPSWTPEQRLAIHETGRNLLVSASAGTGKTTVLVHRILGIVFGNPDADREPVDLDRLLVVTFTEAAAAEMRERIARALHERLADSPPDQQRRIRRQILLLERAHVSTIHAFCRDLLRRYFYRMGLDPEFDILDGQDAELLRLETCDALFEDVFERSDPRFIAWLDGFPGHDPAVNARGDILSVMDHLDSLDDPDGWIDGVRAEYPLDGDDAGDDAGDLAASGRVRPFDEHAWFPLWRRDFEERLKYLSMRLEAADVQSMHVAPAYRDFIDPFRDVVEETQTALAAGEWDKAVALVQNYEFSKMRPVRDKPPEVETLKEELDALRKYFREKIQKDPCFSTSPRDAARLHARSAPTVHLMLDLAAELRRRYSAAKRNAAALDFADLEHLALALLHDPEADDGLSDVARASRDLFEHVLIDEYQDINPVQDAILRHVARHEDPRGPNTFAVGDVKQSIYAFREAEPEIFLEKHRSYPALNATTGWASESNRRACKGTRPPGEPSARIDLTCNFRSRPGILDAVNFLFSRCMTRDGAEIDYDRGAALVPGAQFPPIDGEGGDPLPVEVHFLERKSAEPQPEEDDDEDALQPIEREAALLAGRILEIVGLRGDRDAWRVADESNPATTRPARFRDVVVLLRSLRGRVDDYVAILNACGVPAVADVGTGFFAAPEVRDMLTLLRVIDNPLQDIPLAAFLRSPMVGWNEDDLAEVRVRHPEADYHEAFLQVAVTQAPDDPLAAGARVVLERIDHWRSLARRTSIADLLATLYHETDYPAYSLTVPGRGAARATLRRLQDLARRFDAFSRSSLSRFLRFVDRLCENEEDFGAPDSEAGRNDVVRILTIHKSKGLEFPIVCMPDLGKHFHVPQARSSPLLSRRHGLAVELVDAEARTRRATPGLAVLQSDARRRALAEEMRILYVGLTRARERLVLTISAGNIGEAIVKWDGRAPAHPGWPLPAGQILEAKGPADWIVPVLATHKGAARQLAELAGSGARGASDREIHDGARFRLFLHEEPPIAADIDAEEMVEAGEPTEADRAEARQLLQRIAWRYPGEPLTRTPARVGVSELKSRLESGFEADDLVAAAFVPPAQAPALDYPVLAPRPGAAPASTSLSPTEKGSLTHLVLQHLDLTRPLDYADISAQVDALIGRGVVSEDDRDVLNIDSLERFFDSPLGRRMRAAAPDRVWRELVVVQGLRPSEVGYPELAPWDDEERLRVRGIIDVLFEDENGLVIADYKTDAVTEETCCARAHAYRPQLELYARAIRRIFPGTPVREAVLYFLTLDRAETVPLSDA